ncbi:MAG: hypothetical protein ACI9FD_003911 [Gammaproteobacteria bacterium]|jgi:hypothetical protein
MQSLRKQRGVTIWGVIFVAAVVLSVAFLFMRIFPPYYDNLRILKGMELLIKENDVTQMGRSEIVRRLNRILVIDYVDEIVTMKDVLKMQRLDKGVNITASYEVVVPMVKNLSVLIVFDNKVFAAYSRQSN